MMPNLITSKWLANKHTHTHTHTHTHHTHTHTRTNSNFSGQVGRGVVELGHFDKRSVKNIRKRGPQGNILEIVLPDTLKTIF